MDASRPGSIENFDNISKSPPSSGLRKSPASFNLSSLSNLVEDVAKMALSSNASPNTTNTIKKKTVYVSVGLPIDQTIRSATIPKHGDSKEDLSKKRLSPENKESSKYQKTE